MSGLVGVAALLALLALGVPIGIAMGAVGLIGMMILLGPEPALIKSTVIFFEAVTRFELGVPVGVGAAARDARRAGMGQVH